MGLLLILHQILDEDIKSNWPYRPAPSGIRPFTLADRHFSPLCFCMSVYPAA